MLLIVEYLNLIELKGMHLNHDFYVVVTGLNLDNICNGGIDIDGG